VAVTLLSRKVLAVVITTAVGLLCSPSVKAFSIGDDGDYNPFNDGQETKFLTVRAALERRPYCMVVAGKSSSDRTLLKAGGQLVIEVAHRDTDTVELEDVFQYLAAYTGKDFDRYVKATVREPNSPEAKKAFKKINKLLDRAEAIMKRRFGSKCSPATRYPLLTRGQFMSVFLDGLGYKLQGLKLVIERESKIVSDLLVPSKTSIKGSELREYFQNAKIGDRTALLSIYRVYPWMEPVIPYY